VEQEREKFLIFFTHLLFLFLWSCYIILYFVNLQNLK
jgi:hypothetical protein